MEEWWVGTDPSIYFENTIHSALNFLGGLATHGNRTLILYPSTAWKETSAPEQWHKQSGVVPYIGHGSPNSPCLFPRRAQLVRSTQELPTLRDQTYLLQTGLPELHTTWSTVQKHLRKHRPHWCLSLLSGAWNLPANSQTSPQLVDTSPRSQISFHSCEPWLQKWWWEKTDQYWESTTMYVRDTFSLYGSSLDEMNRDTRDHALCWLLWWHPTDHHSWPHCSPHSSELLTDHLHDSFKNLKPMGTVDLHILISIMYKKTPLQLKAWQLQQSFHAFPCLLLARQVFPIHMRKSSQMVSGKRHLSWKLPKSLSLQWVMQ